jgi:hypothetical protein
VRSAHALTVRPRRFDRLRARCCRA